MRRREFIGLAGGAVAWPLSARSQQVERVRRIGILLTVSPEDTEFQAWIGVFLQALALLGWTIGKNIRVEIRWARGSASEIHRHVAELVALAPDIILAHGASTVRPLLQSTRTVPVVFPIAGDPVGAGFVESLARPGGNATGFMSTEFSMGAKWLELLKEIAPRVTRAAVLRMLPKGREPVSLPLFRPSLLRSESRSLPSICGMQKRLNGALQLLRACLMAA